MPQYGYTGREPDASGLTYYRARYYDPNQTRFTARDPLGYADGINRYAYVGNNPINYNDPNGLFANQVSNAWSAGASYYNTASNIVSQIGWGGAGQFGLDILASSEVPVVSQAAGLGAASIYAYQGDAFGTSTSIAGMFPVAGIIGDAARIGRWADKGVDLARQADNIPVQNVAKEIPISRAKYGEAADHIADAQNAGHPDILTIARDAASTNREASIGGIPKVTGKQLDEYPPAMFKEGGAGASVRPISPRDNMAAGACIGNACRGLANGDKVRIKVTD